jgi:hypothetical protein
LQIEEIFVAAEYKGRTENNFADIAIIVIDKAFKLSATVQPVAVDWGKAHVNKVLRPDKQQFGYVSFGFCFMLPLLHLNLLDCRSVAGMILHNMKIIQLPSAPSRFPS